MGYAEPDPIPEGQDLTRLNDDLDESDRPSRQESAIALRIEGAPYTDIAKTLGYASANHARQAVERGLASTVSGEDREQMRFIEARRLERILRGLWGKATNGEHAEHLAAARTALGVIDRHARLYGLDAPQEMVVYNPTGTELNAWVQNLAAQVREAGPAEVDIVDGYVIRGSDLDDEDGQGDSIGSGNRV